MEKSSRLVLGKTTNIRFSITPLVESHSNCKENGTVRTYRFTLIKLGIIQAINGDPF